MTRLSIVRLSVTAAFLSSWTLQCPHAIAGPEEPRTAKPDSLVQSGDELEPEDLTIEGLTAWHYDSAAYLMQRLSYGRVTPVRTGFVPMIAAERLVIDLELSEDQRLAFWRAYHAYARGVAEPLRLAEQHYFKDWSEGLLAAFPELRPGTDLSHLAPDIAKRFEGAQLMYSRGMNANNRSPAASPGERGSWRGEWQAVSSAVAGFALLGPEYVRIRNRVETQVRIPFLEAEVEIEPPARVELLEFIGDILAEGQVVVWNEMARHRLDLNSYVWNDPVAQMEMRATDSFYSGLRPHNRVDIWSILEGATASGGELEPWKDVLWHGWNVDVDDDFAEEIQNIRINCELALAEIARESARDRYSLLDARRRAGTGDPPSQVGVRAAVDRDRRYHAIVEGFLISMSSAIHRQLGHDAAEAFADRVRAQRFPGIYGSDAVDILLETLESLHKRDPVLSDDIWQSIQDRAEQHFAARIPVRRELADVALRTRVALLETSAVARLTAYDVQLKWMEREQIAKQAVLDLVDDPGVRRVLDVTLAGHDRTRWQESRLIEARKRREQQAAEVAENR